MTIRFWCIASIPLVYGSLIASGATQSYLRKQIDISRNLKSHQERGLSETGFGDDDFMLSMLTNEDVESLRQSVGNALNDLKEQKEQVLTSDQWEESAWKDLPAKALEAAKALGYTQESWDNMLPVDTDYLTWDQLTDEQKEAAEVFGYDQVAWDTTLGGTDDYELFFWDELPADVKEAAKALGYDKNKWNNGISVPTENMMWSQLTEKQKQAAAVFGYDQAKWDSG